jgi:hypothetical protein
VLPEVVPAAENKDMLKLSNDSCCRESRKVLVTACLVALGCIGLALTGALLFGDSFDTWGPLVILSLAGTYAVTRGGGCCRTRRDGPKPKPVDVSTDQLSDWPRS